MAAVRSGLSRPGAASGQPLKERQGGVQDRLRDQQLLRSHSSGKVERPRAPALRQERRTEAEPRPDPGGVQGCSQQRAPRGTSSKPNGHREQRPGDQEPNVEPKATSPRISQRREMPTKEGYAAEPASGRRPDAGTSARRPDAGRRPEGRPDTVIFLDIDGVVHSLYGQDMFRESCCQLLDQIVLGTGASIVLSSTWRTQARSRQAVVEFLKQRRLPVFIDQTRDLSAEMNRHVPREVEICEWIDRHPEVLHWIAIDDMDLYSDNTECARRLRGHFVHTNSNTGLIPKDKDEALRLITMQRRSTADKAERSIEPSYPRHPADSPHAAQRRPAEKTSGRSGQPAPSAPPQTSGRSGGRVDRTDRPERHSARQPRGAAR